MELPHPLVILGAFGCLELLGELEFLLPGQPTTSEQVKTNLSILNLFWSGRLLLAICNSLEECLGIVDAFAFV